MGSHPSGPATVVGTEGTTLLQWLSSHIEALGDVPLYFDNDIPFLFKVTAHPSGFFSLRQLRNASAQTTPMVAMTEPAGHVTAKEASDM